MYNNNLMCNSRQVGKQFEKDVRNEVQKLGIQKVGRFDLRWTLDDRADLLFGTDLMAGNIRYDLTLNPEKSGRKVFFKETYSLKEIGTVRFFLRFSNGRNEFPVPVIVMWVEPAAKLRDWDDIWALAKAFAAKIDPIMETGFNAAAAYFKQAAAV